MRSRNKFILSFTSTVFSSFFAVFLGLIGGIIIAKILGPEGRGQFGINQLYGGILSSIITAGPPLAVIYFSSLNKPQSSEYLINSLYVSQFLALIISFFAYFLIPYFLKSQTLKVVESTQFYLIFIFLSVFTTNILGFLQGRNLIGLWNFVRILASVLWLVAVYLIYYFKISSDAFFLAKAYLFILIIYIFLNFLIIKKYVNLWIAPNFRIIKEIITYSIPNTIYTFSQPSNIKLDQILISLWLMPESLGYYVVAVSWSNIHIPLTSAVIYLILPFLSNYNDVETKVQKANQIIRINLFINALVLIVMLIVSQFFILLIFGEEFKETVSIAYILCISSFFSNLKLTLGEGLRSLGKSKYLGYAEFYTLLVSPLLYYSFYSFFKLHGIALGFLSANIFTTLILAFRYTKHTNVHCKSFIIINKYDINLVLNIFSDLKNKLYEKFR